MRQDTFDIAPARADQAEAITTLVRTSAAYEGQYRVMVASQQLDAAYLATNLVRVASGRDGRLWGFYSLLVPGRGAEGEGELDFMFVANHRQGRGIGRALFEDLRDMAGRLELSRVHIVSHPPSEPFYLACGARRIGVVPPTGRVTWRRPHLALDLRVPAARPTGHSSGARRYASAMQNARPVGCTTCPELVLATPGGTWRQIRTIDQDDSDLAAVVRGSARQHTTNVGG